MSGAICDICYCVGGRRALHEGWEVAQAADDEGKYDGLSMSSSPLSLVPTLRSYSPSYGHSLKTAFKDSAMRTEYPQ